MQLCAAQHAVYQPVEVRVPVAWGMVLAVPLALCPACVARMRCVHSTATVSAAVVPVKQKDVTGTVGNPVCLRRCYTACGDWFGGGLLGFASFY